MTKPLAIDLFCGLGGWTEGLLAEGWNVVWFDIERHVYGPNGEHRCPAQLVLQDVRTMDVKTFKKLVAEARAKNPHCCYCGRDLSAEDRVMYMRGQRRIACADCPEAIAVPLGSSANEEN